MSADRRGPWEHWTTVSYSTVFAIGGGVLVLVLVGLYLMFPQAFQNALTAITSSQGGAAETGPSTARFINLDGTVKVRKRNAGQFVTADYRTPLEEGDIVQTGSDGITRITFIDGTTYVVKSDTLIVIEANTTAANRATRVAVQVTSGAVDLSTGSWEVPGSSSEVRFENAVARMQQNTRAGVRQDARGGVHELTVSEGQAALARGNEVVQLGPYERASFRAADAPISRDRVLAPPKLTRPRNLEPIISPDPSQEVVRFEWEPVEQAKSYRFRLSTSPLFASVAADRQVTTTNFTARGLAPADYYWTVRAVDAKNSESQESEPNRFTLAMQPATEQLLLVIDNVIQHGRVIEVVGRTEPGATVTINAESVSIVGADGRFRHFTSPLPGPGAHSITVVSQNRRGEVVTRTKQVIVK